MRWDLSYVLRIDTLNRKLLENQWQKVSRQHGDFHWQLFSLTKLLERALHMLIAFTYLAGFVTMVFRGMPTVWRGRHARLIFCWLIFMQAVLSRAQDLGRNGPVDPRPASQPGALGVCSKQGIGASI